MLSEYGNLKNRKIYVIFFFKQKTAYEMCGRDWSSDVCSSDLGEGGRNEEGGKIEGGMMEERGMMEEGGRIEWRIEREGRVEDRGDM